MKTRIFSTFATAIFMAGSLTACTQAETPPPVKPVPFACDPKEFASFIGQDESTLYATTFQYGVILRVIKPGQPVTMDYSDARVNFLLDAKGKITKVTCG
jgi:Peptidase inhibitor I78 family